MFGLGAFVLAAVGQELWRGVRARRAMSGDGVPARARGARAPQPPPLRRLPRARGRRGAVRRRRGVLELPGRARGAAAAGPDGRASAPTTSPTSSRPPTCGPRPNGRLEKIDLGAQLRVTRDGRKVADMTTVKSFFPSMAPFLGPDLALLRGRGDQRGRPEGRLAARRLDRDRARHRRAAPADRGGRQGLRRREADARAARRVPRPGARRPHPLLRERTRRPPRSA